MIESSPTVSRSYAEPVLQGSHTSAAGSVQQKSAATTSHNRSGQQAVSARANNPAISDLKKSASPQFGKSAETQSGTKISDFSSSGALVGAAIGGVIGGVGGAVIGGLMGGPKGALVGGVAGALGGALLGGLIGGALGGGGAAPAAIPATVTIPSVIRGALTPLAMGINRIPPRVDTPVSVSVSGLSAGATPVIFSIEGNGGANGTATINSGLTATVSASGTLTLQLSATAQTSPGNAGKLRLVAYQGTTKLASSSPFTISTIPYDMVASLNSELKTGPKRGFIVDLVWNADSGNTADLNEVDVSEEVQYDAGTGCFAGVGVNNSKYISGVPPITDTHSAPISILVKIGKITANQVEIFKDKRAGAIDIPMRKTGYLLERENKETSPGSGSFILTTTKRGAAATANGFSSGAGGGNVSKSQPV